MLFQQMHIGHRHATVHRFAHVIDGQQGHLHRGEGFHLYAGLTHRFDSGGAFQKSFLNNILKG